MISWIQRYFQTHFKIIFGVLLVVIIIAFVFTIGAAPGIGQADRRVVHREFFGYNLALAGDRERLMGDAQLSIGLQFGAFGGVDDDQLRNYAFHRAAALHLADEWKLPAATSDEVSESIRNLPIFAGPDGQFDPQAYAQFRDNLKTVPSGIRESDIVRVLGDDVRAEKVNRLLAGPGYVSPGDVKSQLKRADTEWTLATAAADYASFNPEINPTNDQLVNFFEENAFRYEVPPRVVATHAEFLAADFLGRVSVTEAEARAFYDANPARFPKPAEQKPADAPAIPDITRPADNAADFAAVRPQVEAVLRQERARRLAEQAASDLAVALFDSKVSRGTSLHAFLAARNLEAKPLAPFTREQGPAELGGSREISEAAFRLNEVRFATEALPTPRGATILFWQETLPAHKPLFSTVRDQVAADYIESEKRRRFADLGRQIRSQIEDRVKAGSSFEEAANQAAANAGIKIEVKTLEPFSLRNRPPDADFAVLGTLERLEQGQVSEMAMTLDKGIFVHAIEKKIPDLSESNPQYTETRNQLATMTSRMGGSAYIAELVDRELARTEPKG
jgi:peptidyl-prolyl cis-trans isomerase D